VLVGTSWGVLVVDATTHRVLRRARVPSGVMSLDPGSHVVYSLSQDAVTGRPRVAAFDDRTFALRFDVELPSTDYPSSIAVDPERQVVLVGLYESHQLAAIDPARGRVLGRIALTGAPLDLVVRPRDGRVYVATDGRGIDVLD
jgi:DNA-binding beta-propeller fold protein YncE